MKEVLTPAELAEKMDVSERVVFSWKDQGMPCVKLGKCIFIFWKSFLSWMKELENDKNS